jgi:hypothetical protein
MRRLTLLAAAAVALAAPSPAAAIPPVVGGTSFNDAAAPIAGSFSDALDTGTAVFYRVHLEAGQRLDASAALDVSSLDPSLTGTSSLTLRLYDPLRGKDAEAQAVGPGDTNTHLKSTSAEVGPVREQGDYYVSAGVNDFLPDGSRPVQLPLGMTLNVTNAGAKPAPRARLSSGGSGTGWAVLAALCAGGLLVGAAGGAAFRCR